MTAETTGRFILIVLSAALITRPGPRGIGQGRVPGLISSLLDSTRILRIPVPSSNKYLGGSVRTTCLGGSPNFPLSVASSTLRLKSWAFNPVITENSDGRSVPGDSSDFGVRTIRFL